VSDDHLGELLNTPGTTHLLYYRLHSEPAINQCGITDYTWSLSTTTITSSAAAAAAAAAAPPTTLKSR
jgi:hypothetical protein